MARYLFYIFLILYSSLCFSQNIDLVRVEKSEKVMYLLSNGKIVKKYNVSFGGQPKGHKQQEGDERTPEGKYILDYKKDDSAFHKAIHISYPNDKDKEHAKNLGFSPGGQIMIHGQKNGFGWASWIMQKFNWTNGCIAVTNKEMDEIWQLVSVGTPILINP